MFGMADNDEYEIIPARLAIKAMVDGSYKNTAYALAELMDNSIEAGADFVELICIEEYRQINNQRRQHIDQIIVADDGCGMDKDLLHKALQVGFGSRLDASQQKGMGRFGVGLPLASIGQADLIEVWSWKNGGYKNAYHQYLSVKEVVSGDLTHFSEPTRKPVPNNIIKHLNHLNDSGTIVFWDHLSDPKWSTGDGILRNSEEVIGRMYRQFLSEGSVEIRLANIDAKGSNNIDRNALANDPLYLMKNTSTPAPWRDEPMFVQHHKTTFQEFKTPDGKIHMVEIKASVAKKEARVGDSSGSKPYGVHAKKNIGISVKRAGREIQMVQSHIKQDVTERWWGIEIDFPPQLDEIFGISNDKQSAKDFESIWSQDPAELKAQLDMHDQNSSFVQLSELCFTLYNLMSLVRKAVVAAKGSRLKPKGPQRPVPSPEDGATEVTKVDPKPGDSDEPEKAPLDERLKEIIENLIKKGYSKEDAEDIALLIKDDGSKYYTAVKDMASPDFFNTETVAGCLEVTLNLNHKAMIFLDILNKQDEIEYMGEDDLKLKLHQIVYGMKLVLYAWARLRDQATPDEKDQMDEIRIDWGKKAKAFFGTD